MYTELDVRNATPPPRFEVKAPEGAPNVIVVLVDDLGFAGTSTFGGPVGTPTFDRLADAGTALQQLPHHRRLLADPRGAQERAQPPRRQHGRDHRDRHGVSRATPARSRTTSPRWPRCCASTATARRPSASGTRPPPGRRASRVRSTAGRPIRASTSSTAFSAARPTSGRRSSTTASHPVELPDDPDYHFLTDMTDQAVAWIRYQKALTPDRPFFVYFAPGATHAPHHVPKEWIERWKGKFDQGWDTLREEILARQIELGIVPEGTPLAPKPEAIPDWDTLSADEKRLFTRQVEVFAAYVEMTDYEIGRVIEAIEETGELDNTLDLPGLRRQRHQRRGRPQRHVQRDDLLQRRAGEGRGHAEGGSTSGAAPRPTRTWPRAGPWRSTRPTSGPSRSRRTTAAPRSAWPSTGPRASRPRASCAPSSTT